jgi:hypothetical protein
MGSFEGSVKRSSHQSASLLFASAAAACLAVFGVGRPASAEVAPVPSWDFLTTGNGFGFQVFDADRARISGMLERPYRYLRPGASERGEGVVRRNLAFDIYFGLRAGSSADWLAEVAQTRVGYRDQTNVIESVGRVGGVTAHSYFFAPFGLEQNAMVMIVEVEGTGADLSVFSLHNLHMGTGDPDNPGSNGEEIEPGPSLDSAVETGPASGAMIYVPIGGLDSVSCSASAWSTVRSGGDLDGQESCSRDDAVSFFQRDLGTVASGESASWGVAVMFAADGDAGAALDRWETFLAGRDAETLLADTLAEWEEWRRPPPVTLSDEERRIWRQSEAVLRMSQIREPYTSEIRNHGMILASLPPGGWHTGWVRDAMYAIVPLARSGHHEEARLGLEFFLNADAGYYASYLEGVDDYLISVVRYYGNGREEADYSGQPSPNVEVDGWGLFLWAARAYVSQSGNVEWLNGTTRSEQRIYDVIRDGVAEPLAAYMEPQGIVKPDSSIWEVHHNNRRHYAYTTLAAGRGFCDMAAMASMVGETEDAERYRALSSQIAAAVPTLFVDRNNALAGSLEGLGTGSNYYDGAVVEAFGWDIVDPTGPVGQATLDAFTYLVTPAGGF